METAPLETTKISYLRADQIEEMEGERETLERKLGDKHVQDKGAVREQIKRLDRQLEQQRPTAYQGSELDRAVAREAELRDEISKGMLSHEEMRKCPPGAVDRHRQWEKAKKPLILEWQNIQRRLNSGNDNREVASIETFRPWLSTMSMDNAFIPGKQYHLPPPGAPPAITFDSAEIALIRQHAPDVAVKLALLTHEQRAEMKEIVRGFNAEKAA